MDLAAAVSEYGFPIIAAFGLGYFVYYIWQWVTTEIQPVVGEASSTLIKLVDRIRMLDNDMIRLNTKLSMVLENQAKLNKDRRAELEAIVNKYSDLNNDTFDSTGDNK